MIPVLVHCTVSGRCQEVIVHEGCTARELRGLIASKQVSLRRCHIISPLHRCAVPVFANRFQIVSLVLFSNIHTNSFVTFEKNLVIVVVRTKRTVEVIFDSVDLIQLVNWQKTVTQLTELLGIRIPISVKYMFLLLFSINF